MAHAQYNLTASPWKECWVISLITNPQTCLWNTSLDLPLKQRSYSAVISYTSQKRSTQRSAKATLFFPLFFSKFLPHQVFTHYCFDGIFFFKNLCMSCMWFEVGHRTGTVGFVWTQRLNTQVRRKDCQDRTLVHHKTEVNIKILFVSLSGIQTKKLDGKLPHPL